MPMPDRLVPMLRNSFVGLMTLYVALVISTVYFAARETDYRDAIHDTEASIAALEARYFAAVDRITKTDPAALGLGAPAGKRYAREAPAPSVSLLVQ